MIGQTISHYRVEEQIGAGGMGVVYRAHDERLERDVALKVLSPALVNDQEFLSRFRREARILSKLNHPNIATVHDFDTVDGVSFLVMELIKGQTLDRKLRTGPLPESEVLRLGKQLLEGLAAAHAEGIIHRDLKPGNLRETPAGLLKILDFGLARMVQTDLQATQSNSSTAIVGTLPYMAPEQLEGEPLDARTDIYATGVVLYELAVGRRPFTDELASRLIDAILHRNPPSPREINPDISPALEAVIVKALEKDPSQRFHSAGEMHTALLRLSGDQTVPLPEPRTIEVPASQVPPMEMAHILFTDIVGYSKLPMDEQQRTLRHLQDLVRHTSEFSKARDRNQLVSLPTGDGMALVFFGEPESAPRCALELSRKLKPYPEIQLRMGVNTGPVYRVSDINLNRNVAGGGINVAQRVMDCGDGGHILVSKASADVLRELSAWQGSLLDLGVVPVKHGVPIHIFNLVSGEVGNRQIPTKVLASRTFTQKIPRRPAAIASVLLLSLAVLATVFIVRHRESTFEPEQNNTVMPGSKNLRPTVAILGFKNHTNAADADWVSTSLSDILAGELAAGDQVVPISGEAVTRMKLNLALPNEASYAFDTVKKVRTSLHCDYVVYGGFFDTGKSAGGNITVSWRLQRASDGELMASMNETGTEMTLPTLASAVGAVMRSKLGLPGVTVSQSSELRAAVPSTPEAARYYYQGLEQLRTFDLWKSKESFTKSVKLDPGFSLAHTFLAESWELLGYDDKAREEAKLAFDFTSHLRREDKTLVEARYRAISGEWDQAANLYRSLFTLYPENPEYAYRATDMLIRAGKANDAVKTIEGLRATANPIAGDPRLDLKEAEAAESLSDFAKEEQLAMKAADGAHAKGYRLLEAEALWRGCAAKSALGKAADAQTACKNSIALAEPAGDLLLVARGFTVLGRIAEAKGDLANALSNHQQALKNATKIGSRRDTVGALLNIANVMADRGDFAGAQSSYEQALAVATEINDRNQIITLLNNMATINQAQGKYPEALKLYERSLRQARAIMDKDSAARAQNNIGAIYAMQGNFAKSLQNVQDAVAEAAETGNQSDHAQFVFTLGIAKLAQGDLAAAESNFQAGLKLAREVGDKSTIAFGQMLMADLKLQSGKAGEVETLARPAADEFHAEGMKEEESDARNLLAAAFIALGKKDDADKEMTAIAGLSPQDPAVKLAVAITAGRLQARGSQQTAAKKRFEDVLNEATKLGIPALQFEARLAEGERAALGGDKAAARALLTALEKDADRKGFRQFAARARNLAAQGTVKAG